MFLEDAVDCVIVGRVNRFVVRVLVNGVPVDAHLTNTGRLTELLTGGRRGLCIPISGRRLGYRLVGVLDRDGFYAVVDTLTQNRFFEYLLSHGSLPWLRGCSIVSRSPVLGGSRLDYLLDCGGERVYVETKSAVLRGAGGEAMYPDCPSLRGRRHIVELTRFVEGGGRGLLVFIAGFRGPRCFMPYRGGDSVIYDLLCRALEKGVGVRAFSIYMERDRVLLDNPSLPLCSHWFCG